jgi:hypothetical protein
MRPLYDARVEDLGPADFIEVKCVCGHEALIVTVALTQSLRLSGYERILGLQRRLRCQECDRRVRYWFG